MSDRPSPVLVVADPADCRLVVDLLRRELEGPALPEIVDDGSFAKALDGPPPAVVVVGQQTGWTDGVGILRRVRAACPDCAVIMLTSERDEPLAAAAL
ncbi:MAG: response regulator [Alphaproteobacteria bacterium]|nr:response regulator [Alphaproteobacteria bacterium]